MSARTEQMSKLEITAETAKTHPVCIDLSVCLSAISLAQPFLGLPVEPKRSGRKRKVEAVARSSHGLRSYALRCTECNP